MKIEKTTPGIIPGNQRKVYTMSDDTTPSTEQLMELFKKLNEKTEGEDDGWGKKKATSSSQNSIKSVSIPISLETSHGKLRVYLGFDGTVADTPETLMSLIESLDAKGLPLDFWAAKKDWKKKSGW